MLAEGGEGIVYAAQPVEGERKMKILKVMKESKTSTNSKIVPPQVVPHADESLQEIRNIYPLSHPNILGVETIFKDSEVSKKKKSDDPGSLDTPRKKTMCVIQEISWLGDLRLELIKRKEDRRIQIEDGMLSEDDENEESYFSEFELGTIALDFLSGLSYLHGQGICHLDIKPENTLVFPGPHYQITDFGCAKKMLTYNQVSDDQAFFDYYHIVVEEEPGFCLTKTSEGTPTYQAPELQDGVYQMPKHVSLMKQQPHRLKK